MLSRRSFLAASLGVLLQPGAALAAKKKPVEVRKLGPHTLALEQWPPAISPDFVSIVDRGYALLSDQSGRLAIVDLKREQGPLVIGELFGIGKKTVDMAVTTHRAYALAYQEAGTDAQHYLVTISITPPNDPTILSKIPLNYLSEPTSIAASNDAVAVAGISTKGENQVLLYGINSKRRPDESTVPAATINFDQAITNLDLQERQLSVLQAGTVTYLDVFNLFNVRNPERVGEVRLEGNYPLIARTREAIILAGQSSDRKQEVVAITPRAPKVVSRAALAASEILDIAAQRGQVLALVNQINRQAVVPVAYNSKSLAMSAGEAATLPQGNRGAASKARIAVRGAEAYVASDWGGVQVLMISKSSWQYVYSHTIPRLPAAGVAVAGSKAVLAGADLKVYDITQPDHPALLSTTELGGTVRGVRLISNLILAFAKDTLTLRKIDRPGETSASVKVVGQNFAYDEVDHRAYVLNAKDKATTITAVRVSGALVAEKPQQIDGLFNKAAANRARLLVAGLNNLALYTVSLDNNGSTISPAATRTFPNLAIRSLAFAGDNAIVTAVDANSRGYVLTINTSSADLSTIGSVDVPQDAVAVAISESGKQAVVVGRGTEGKDVASIVDISNAAGPKVVQSFPVLEAASAVVIQNKLALVVGRGLEILTLS